MSKFQHIIVAAIAVAITIVLLSFSIQTDGNTYESLYHHKINDLIADQSDLLSSILKADLNDRDDRIKIIKDIHVVRNTMKAADFWLRYLEPLAYKKINSPLPVEWETEVFEKSEKPYKREGAGIMLAELYLE
jgi:cytochrome c peroxidase